MSKHHSSEKSNSHRGFQSVYDRLFVNLNGERELELIGRLAGTVFASQLARQLSFPFVLRWVTAVGGYYSGSLIGLVAYAIVQELLNELGEVQDNSNL